MEEELNYVTVTFRSNGISPHEKTNTEIIYDEVKTGEEACIIIRENQKEAPICSPTTLVVALLGSTCLLLVSAIVTLSFHFVDELRRQNVTLTDQNLRLWTEKADLKKQMEHLTRDRDRLNWTVGVIMEYDNFPVKEHCPLKECKPCLDGWVLFQLNCYLFAHFEYYKMWKNWRGSLDHCRENNADLVVIGSREEQEFISNHTKKYDDAKHGYWIGLSKNTNDVWLWVDGSDLTEMYWVKESYSSRLSCAISNPHEQPLDNWNKVSCDMRNRWICETRALIRPDEESVTNYAI